VENSQASEAAYARPARSVVAPIDPAPAGAGEPIAAASSMR